MASTSSDQRFAHLLEPIRDLAQNWSIDVAAELEEYLSELEAITISFEDGQQLNFAEAALVIQGSACIYSKKVEHLYDLVYRTLNQVVEKKRVAKEAASIDAEGVDADAPVEEEEPFLTLDDTLVEVDNITLPPNRGAPDPTAHTLTRTPLDLLPAEKSDAGVDSKMNACKMAHGALLLPHSQLHAEPRLLADFLGTPLGADAAAAPSLGFDAPYAANDDDDGDHAMADDGGGWDEADWSAVNDDGATQEGADVDATQAAPPGTPAAARAAAAAAAAWDPWAPLDPHDPSGATARPFRRKKTYATGKEMDSKEAAMADAEEGGGCDEDATLLTLDDDKENEAAAQAAGQPAASWAGGDVLAQLGLLRAGVVPSAVPLRAPLFPQFDSLHTAEGRRRAAVRRELRKATAQRHHVGAAEPDAGAEVEANEALPRADVDDLPAYADDDDLPGFGGDDDDDAPLRYPDGSHDVSPGGRDGPADAMRGRLAAAEGAGAESYEELCRAHAESLLVASDGCARRLPPRPLARPPDPTTPHLTRRSPPSPLPRHTLPIPLPLAGTSRTSSCTSACSRGSSGSSRCSPTRPRATSSRSSTTRRASSSRSRASRRPKRRSARSTTAAPTPTCCRSARSPARRSSSRCAATSWRRSCSSTRATSRSTPRGTSTTAISPSTSPASIRSSRPSTARAPSSRAREPSPPSRPLPRTKAPRGV